MDFLVSWWLSAVMELYLDRSAKWQYRSVLGSAVFRSEVEILNDCFRSCIRSYATFHKGFGPIIASLAKLKGVG